jgi:hypothetical protein
MMAGRQSGFLRVAGGGNVGLFSGLVLKWLIKRGGRRAFAFRFLGDECLLSARVYFSLHQTIQSRRRATELILDSRQRARRGASASRSCFGVLAAAGGSARCRARLLSGAPGDLPLALEGVALVALELAGVRVGLASGS